MLREAAKDFLGIIKQQPPSYSSLKIDGKRASDRVRRGEDISLKSRDVTIYRFDIKEFSLSTGEIFFEIECSKGTYIRSMHGILN
jgi:tRNA pseudouridine55 synthase